MGGDREDFVPAKTAVVKPNSEIILADSRIRFHESNGEVHFHDDKNGLKVAIKSPIWHAAWESLKTKQEKEVILKDCQGGKTELIVKVSYDDFGVDGVDADASLTIREVNSWTKPKNMSSVFAALERFSNPSDG